MDLQHASADTAATIGYLETFPQPLHPTAKDIHARVGSAIRRRRRAIEVTLLELAQACGVSFQQVQKYESGACAISAAQLWNMACALNVPVSYFYESGPAEA
jgi:DNA-binding transcriptional regulator YiaG